MGFVTNRWQPVSTGPAPVVPVRYGIKINESNQTVEYLYDAVGFTPVLMNTSTGLLDYGSWANTPLIKSNYPAVTTNRNYSTAIDYKLNPNDYSKKEDGTSSNISTPNGDVVAVFEGGWLYTYEETVSNVKYIYIIWSDTQYDSNYQCYHRDNHKSFAVGIYNTDSSKTSRSNKTPSATYDSAKAIKWAQLNYIYCLMMIITKSVTSFKTNLGLYFDINAPTTTKTGRNNNKGQFYSYQGSDYKTYTNHVFHIEDFLRVIASSKQQVAGISASTSNKLQPYYITASGVTQAYSSFKYEYYSSNYRTGVNVPNIFASTQGVFPTGVTRTSVSKYHDISAGNKAMWSSNSYSIAVYDYSYYIGFNDTGTNTMHISHYID